MLKVLAVVRTVFLLFIIGYTLRAMPFITTVSRTFDEQYAICSSSLHQLIRAAWLAIAWIALETVVGWMMAGRRRPAAAAPRAPGPEAGAPPSPP